jgi:EAL and modified HD-GYP domain-containing signal transduction protein
MSQGQQFSHAFVARQPICDAAQRTFAYELLFRNSDANRATIVNGEKATADVVVNSFMEIGLERMVGSALAFINVTHDFIADGHCRALPKDRVVLEILEDTPEDFELTVELNRLRATGYRFALDDYTFAGAARTLLPYSTFVKVDLRQVDRASIERELPRLREQNQALLAEKVETREEFEFCKRVGFEYFQGYFFCRPDIVSTITIPANRASLFRLLAKLHNPEIDARELEAIVGEDLSLSYKLLRYINSAYLGLSSTIESVGHAVRLVGIDHIRMLASLLMLSTVNDKPKELITISLIRAKMCQLEASRLGFAKQEPFFTVGLFSALDAFLDCPMDQALNSLPLSDRIRHALLKGDGPLGEVLTKVLDYERNPLGSQGLTPAYWEAVDWQQQLLAQVH